MESQGNPKIPLTFKIYQGEQLLRSERLVQDIIKVGKLPSSHLRIDDENVSRMHAVIEVTGEDIFIIDLGSAAGTIVNGSRVNKCKLQNGDELKLGETRVVVEVGSAETVADEDATVVSDSQKIPDAALPSARPPAPPPASARPPSPAVPAAPAAAPMPAAPAPAPAASPFAAPAASPFAAPGGGFGFGAPLANPFAPPPPMAADVGGEIDESDPEKVQYGIVASGPPVSADEVEQVGAAGVEVVIMWGDTSVLQVAHMSPPRPYYVGESGDFLVGSESLGTDRLPVIASDGLGVAVVIPPGATGHVTVGEQRMSWADMIAQGKVQPSAEVRGGHQYPLPAGATAKVVLPSGLVFLVKGSAPGRRISGGFIGAVTLAGSAYTLVSLGVHGAFLFLLYFMPPSPSSISLDVVNTDSRLVRYMLEPPETQVEETPEFLNNTDNPNEDEGGKGKRHKGEEGQMGKRDAKKTNNRYGIQGPADNPDPHMARENARTQAQTTGIIGILRASSGSWNAPTSEYGRDTALGNDPMSALGALMGDQIGENFGYGGLGLRGTGLGGGGTGEGTIGLGNIGLIGHGAGGGSGSGYGRGSGYGSGVGRFHGRSASVPRVRAGTAAVVGSLSKEVIRRVIRRHINEVRFCYERALSQRPDLQGRVSVRFVISASGSVQSSSNAGSSLGNATVESCIVSAVRRWTFPAPEGGGIVVVTYPFMLQSAEGGDDG